jgi:hypothetical protein
MGARYTHHARLNRLSDQVATSTLKPRISSVGRTSFGVSVSVITEPPPPDQRAGAATLGNDLDFGQDSDQKKVERMREHSRLGVVQGAHTVGRRANDRLHGAWRIILVAFVAAASPILSHARAQPACPMRSTASPQVEVVILNPQPRLSRDTTVSALHGLSGQPQRANFHHLGVTVLRMEWRGEVQLSVATDPQGICAVVTRVRVTLAHVGHRILIAREIPQGGCLYQEVETHERRHVAANRRALREAVAPVGRALEAWAANAETRAATAEAAREALLSGLQATMTPLIAAVQERRDVANRAIDSPEEYRRIAQSCGVDQLRLQDRLRNP